MVKVLQYAVVVVTTLVGLVLLWQFAGSLVLFVLSLAVAAALRPLITSLTSPRVSKRMALGIVYTFVILSLVVFFLLISPSLLQDLQNVTNDFVSNYEYIKQEWPRTGSLFQQALAEQLPPSAELFQALTSVEAGAPVLTGVFAMAQNFLSSLGNVAIVIILSLYWSADQLRFERLGLSIFPDEYHSKALQVWRSVETRVGRICEENLFKAFLPDSLYGWAMQGWVSDIPPCWRCGWRS